MELSNGTLFMVSGGIFEYWFGSLGRNDHPYAQSGIAWVCALRRGFATFPGAAIDFAASCQFLYVFGGIGFWIVFFSLGNTSYSSDHPMDFKRFDQSVAFDGHVIYYFDARLTFFTLATDPSPV